jgi:hypothetical protein
MFSIANYKGVMIGLLSSAALAVAQVTLSASAGSQPEPTAFLVEVQEGTTDLSRQGASGHICVLVLPDGRFHLESRTQRLPGAEATLNLSDYFLATYVQPAIPMAVPWSHALSARIARSGVVQYIGYWTWRGGTPAASPNSAPAGVKKGWQESETALRPLVDWLHAIEALKLAPSDMKSTMCASDD